MQWENLKNLCEDDLFSGWNYLCGHLRLIQMSSVTHLCNIFLITCCCLLVKHSEQLSLIGACCDWRDLSLCLLRGCPWRRSELSDERVSRSTTTVSAHKLQPCVFELCKFFSQCLCKPFSHKTRMKRLQIPLSTQDYSCADWILNDMM